MNHSKLLDLVCMLSLSLALGCGGGGSLDPDGGAQGDANVNTDANGITDTGPPDDGEVDLGGPAAANEAVAGTWTLVSPSSACDSSFAGAWTATPVDGSELAFTVSDGNMITLSCALSASEPTDFVCSNLARSGQIPPNCNVSMSVIDIGGSVVDGNVSLQGTFTRSSSNCGQALNCAPTQNLSTGTRAAP